MTDATRSELREKLLNVVEFGGDFGTTRYFALTVELRDALVAALTPATWQPMETAPKDGTTFIGWFAGRATPRIIRLGRWIPEIASFGWDGTQAKLLAWMPLPDPPQEPTP